MPPIDSDLIAASSVKAYFHDAFAAASRNQAVAVDDMTAAYVINLLSAYSTTSTLKPVSDEHGAVQALALLYAQANDAESEQERNHSLQRLGDIALFIAGIFTDSLSRKAVDIDYYIGMGENAYSSLYVSLQKRSDRFSRSELFAELGAKFSTLVDVLSEVSERSGLKSNKDTLRTYELWQRSGSARAHKQLRRMGIIPLTPTAVH